MTCIDCLGMNPQSHLGAHGLAHILQINLEFIVIFQQSTNGQSTSVADRVRQEFFARNRPNQRHDHRGGGAQQQTTQRQPQQQQPVQRPRQQQTQFHQQQTQQQHAVQQPVMESQHTQNNDKYRLCFRFQI
jgi:hypothetical protein